MAEYLTKREASAYDLKGGDGISFSDSDTLLYSRGINITRITPYTPDSCSLSPYYPYSRTAPRFLVHFEFLVFFKDNRSSRWIKDVVDTPYPFSEHFRSSLVDYVSGVRDDLHTIDYRPEEL